MTINPIDQMTHEDRQFLEAFILPLDRRAKLQEAKKLRGQHNEVHLCVPTLWK